MTPLDIYRGVFRPAVIAACVWGASGAATAQESNPPAPPPENQVAPSSQPAEAPTSAPTSRKTGRTRITPTTAPSTQPAVAPSDSQPTGPATQAARDRLSRFNSARDAATRPATSRPTWQRPSTQATSSAPSDDELSPREQNAKRMERLRAEREERMRKAREVASRAANPETPNDEAVTETPPPDGTIEVPAPEDGEIQPEQSTDQEQTVAPPPRPGRPNRPVTPPTKTTPHLNNRPKPGETHKPPVEELEAPVAVPTLPDDGRTEFMNFKDMPWEDVVQLIAKRRGKPLMNVDESVFVSGKLTYQSDRRFTPEEMLDELNFLLSQQQFFIAETENYIYLLPLNELSKVLDPSRYFDSLEAFDAAKLRDMEFASVTVKIDDRPAEDVRDMVAPAMPDYALPVVVGDTNSLKIEGLARDVRRFESMLSKSKREAFDPRQTRYFTIKTSVRDIESMVREMLDLAPSATAARTTTRTRPIPGRPTAPETETRDTSVRIMADERTKTLIVKATIDKLKEIEEFIKKIDEKPEIGEFDTHVIPVANGDAGEIANLLNQIFQQEKPQQQQARNFRSPVTRTSGRTQQPVMANTGTPTPQDIIVEDLYEQAKKAVRLVADERTNSLIVYANPDGLKRVTELLEVIDKPMPSNFRTFKLEHADSEDVYAVVDQLARNLSGGGRGSRAISVVRDATANALHVVAEREEMNRIADVISQLDIAGEEEQRHVVELTNVKPSEMAPVVEKLLGAGGPAVAAPVRSGRGARGGATASTRVIALDQSGLLIVYCTDDAWEKVEDTISIWDKSALSDTPEVRFYEPKNADAQSLSDTLGQLYRNYQHPVLGRSNPVITVDGGRIVVQAVKPALDEIDALMPSLDVAPGDDPLVILPLAYADAAQVADIAQSLLPQKSASRGAPRRGGGGGGGEGPSVQAEPATNSLIIQADELTRKRIIDFARDMDKQVEDQQPERRYYTLKNANPQDVVRAVSEIFGASTGQRGRGRATGTQIKALQIGAQVVIDAPAVRHAEISALIDELDERGDRAVTTSLVRVPGVDVAGLARRLEAVFAERVKRLGVVAEFEPDASTDTILMTCSADVIDEAHGLLREYQEVSAPQVTHTEFRRLTNGSATEAVTWLRDQLVTSMTPEIGAAAAKLIKVSADQRTNRVIINAPPVAVKEALALLDQYDQPAEEAVAPIDAWTAKLPGMDVNAVAQNLQAMIANLPRNDKLKAVVRGDTLTNTLIISAPKDMRDEIDNMIKMLTADAGDAALEQRFFAIENADANYVAQQLQGLMNTRISRNRGQAAAQQVNVQVDTRMNRVIMNAPKFAIEMAEALVKELDQPQVADNQMRTVPLLNADANTVLGIINTIFREKISARTLQVTVEPLTNSLIVGGSNEDFKTISEWAKQLDSKAKDAASEQRFFELKNANPWEVHQVLQQSFVQKAAGRRVAPGQEIKTSVIAGRSILVEAPPEKMKEIDQLIVKLDEIGSNQTVVRTYKLPGLGSSLDQLARQIADAVNSGKQQRDQGAVVTPFRAAESLIVTATPDQLPKVEQFMEQFKGMYEPAAIATIALDNADANLVLQALQRVLKSAIDSGRVQLSAETMTNSLVVSAGPTDLAEIQKWSKEFDAAAITASKTQVFELKFVDAGQAATQVQQIIGAQLGAQKGNTLRDFSITADSRTNHLIVQAPERMMGRVQAAISQIDVDAPEQSVVTVALKYADPGQLSSMLQQMFGQRGGAGVSQEVMVQVSNGQLVLKAPPKKLEAMKALVAKIDSEDPGELEIRMFDLKVLDAERVSTQVNLFLASTGNLRAGQMKPAAFAEPTTNTLVVLAPRDKLPFIESLINQIEANEIPEALPRSYDLVNARADQVAPAIEQMLKAKVAEREGPKSPIQPRVIQEPSSNRLFVYAPEEYQELATELVKMVDKEVDTGELVHIIHVESGDAQQIAQTVQQTLQKPPGRSGATPKVAVASDVGSNSVILSGLPKDIAEVESLVKDLEANSSSVPELQIFQLKNSNALDVSDTLAAIFPSAKNPMDNVVVTEDEFYNRLTVAASKRRMRHVEAVIAQLDVAPAEGENAGLLGDKEIYFVKVGRGDPFDIAYDVQDLFPDPDRGGPKIDADLFGDNIKVICRPSEYPKIEKLIKQFDDKAKPEIVIKEVAPKVDFTRYAEYLKLRNPNVKIHMPEGGEVRESIIETLHPEDEEKDKPAADPHGARGPSDGSIKLASFQTPPAEVEKAQPTPKPAPAKPESTGSVEDAVINVLPNGRFIMQGLKRQIDDIQDTIDLIEEDLGPREVLRIFKFRSGDVNAAARILELMFNERQAGIRFPQGAQGVQQMQQLLQQPGGGRQGRGNQGGDDEDRQGGGGGGLLDQLRGMVGGGRNAQGQQGGSQGKQSGGDQMRIATDSSHNYLIIKCSEALLPDIRQLLRELDIPPAEVDVRVFQLKNLDATETAENIKRVLGIGRTQQARPQQPQPNAGGFGPQAQLLQILQQSSFATPGVEGSAKVENVEVVANAVTNSLLVSAPLEVMKLIEDTLKKLEDLEGRDVVVIRSYTLQNARMDDVLPLLQEIFTGVSSGGGSRGAKGAKPADFGAVSISGDPRTRTLIYSAQAKDVPMIVKQIEMLDIDGAIAEAETYACSYGDAVAIAEAVQQLFASQFGGSNAGGGGPRRGGQSAALSSSDLRITAEPTTNVVLVWGPVDQRKLILAEVEKLDKASRRDIREIPVSHADPEKLAERLSSIFGGTSVQAGAGRRGASNAIASTQGRLVIVGSKDAGKLLVRAPDAVFEQIGEVVKKLDTESEQLQVRRYNLSYNDAKVVVDAVKGALFDFVNNSRLTGSELGNVGVDAFTAIAEPRTNSVLVLGSEQTFKFVEALLTQIDVETPDEQKKQFKVFVLREANAQVVADAVNNFASAGAASPTSSTGGPGGGRQGRGGIQGLTAGATIGAGEVLNVSAVAEPATNSVLVFGKPEDIALVEQSVINQLESAVTRTLARIPVKEISPSQMASYIGPLLDSSTEEGRTTAQITPNDSAKNLVVWGTQSEIDHIKNLVSQFDVAGMEAEQIKVIQVPFGFDAAALASEVSRVVNDGERILAESRGIPARQITIGSSQDRLIVYGNASVYGMVENVVNQLTEGAGNVVTRVVQLANLSSDDAMNLISDLQQRRQGGSSGSRGPSITPGGGTRSGPINRPSGGSRSGGNRTGGSRSGSRGISPPPPRPSGPGGAFRWRAPWQWESLHQPKTEKGGAIVATVTSLPSVLLAPFMMQAAAPQPEQVGSQPASAPRGVTRSGAVISGNLRGDVVATPVDSRRLIVTGDQRDVDFILQMLQAMEVETPAPVIEVFTLAHAKAAAIAPVLEQTLQALIDTGGGSGDRVNRFSIIAEARSNSLIVSASEENIELVASIVERLDIDTLTGTEFNTVKLTHIQAAEAVKVLKPVIDRMNQLNDVPAEAQASVEPVERSNSLFIIGTPADMASIKKMIDGIDVEPPAEDDFNLAWGMFIELKNARAEDLAKTLNDLIEAEKANSSGQSGAGGRLIRRLMLTAHDGRELPPLDLDRPVKIIAEKATNSIVVFSSPKNNESLREIVALFDDPPTGAEIEVKSIPLRHASAKTIAETLQKVFDEGKKALARAAEGEGGSDAGVMAPVPSTKTGEGLPYNVFISSDPRTNNVLVVGRKEAVLLAAGLIAELDRPAGELAMQPKLIPLRNIQATKLQERLTEMLEKRAEALGGADSAAHDNAVLLPDDRSNTLVVIATDDTFELLNNLATQLDSATSHRVVDSLWRRLKFADAAKIASMVQQLFEKKKEADQDVTEGAQKDVLHVFADARSNSLMMTGTRDYLEEAAQLIDKLDQSYEATTQVKVRPVVLNSAANIATLLTDMIEKSQSDQGDLKGSPIHVAADPYSNNLLLAASQEDMLMLERWIEVLDRPAEPGRVTRIIPLKRGDAEKIAEQAQELFAKEGESAKDVTVTNDATTNSVVAIGPPAVVRDIESFVERLNDTEAPGGDLVRIFKLQQADAERAGELLRNIIEGRGGSVGGGGGSSSGGGGSAEDAARKVMLIYQQQRGGEGSSTFKALRNEINVIDDVRTNSLVVTAPPESMGLVESLVTAIDVPPDAAKIRVFPLRNSDAEQMVETLEKIFEEKGASTASSTSQDGQQRVLTLGEGSVGGQQELIFTVDTRTNSVIAAGTTGYLDVVEKLVLDLDSQPIEERKTFVYHPRNNEAVAIQEAISDINDQEQQLLSDLGSEISDSRRMERQVLAVASEDTNRVILSYDPRREGDVLDLVRELDQPPPQVMIQVLVVEVTMDSTLELGVEFAFQDLQFAKAGPTDTTQFDFVGGTDIGAAGSGLGGFTFTISGSDFNFLFRTLQTEGKLNVVSRPQIVAMDNQEATFEVFNDVPFISGTTASGTGLVTTSVDREEVGIRLTVTPHINPDGFVRMEVEQEVSDITPSSVDVGGGVSQPIFLRRKANTVVTVKDAETVVLGGLITSREQRAETKVPLIGDVPIVGNLFSSKDDNTTRTELLIVLTPTIVRTVEDYRELSARERDRLTEIPEESLTSDLMEKLRLTPEELRDRRANVLLGPFPREKETPEQMNEDDYGPIRKGDEKDDHKEKSDNYDIPISAVYKRGGK